MSVNLVGRWRVGIVLVLVPLAVAAVVLALLAGISGGGLLWPAFGLAVVGALVLLASAAHGRYAWVGVGGLAAAAVVSGWAVWSTPTVDESDEPTTLLGAGAPSVLTAVSWLLIIVVVLAGIVTVLWRADFTGLPGRLWCVLLAAAVVAAGVAGTAVWLGGRAVADLRTDAIAGSTVDHTVNTTTDPTLSTKADTVSAPAGWRKLWQQPVGDNRTLVSTPTKPVLVAADLNVGDQSGITVYDSRTGVERWHWRSRLFYDSYAAVSSAGRVLIVVKSSAILLDLYSGAELKRFALQQPVLQPGSPQVHYVVAGPQPHDLFDENSPPLIELTGTVAPILVRGLLGQIDVLAVSLTNGTVTTVAAGLPRLCRVRAIRNDEYTNLSSSTTWLLRDGSGCGAPTLTRLMDGIPQSQTPAAPVGCEPQGCDLADAYATPEHVVVQTATELLTFDPFGTLQSHTPAPADRRSVLPPKAATPTLLPPDAMPRKNTVFARDGATYITYRATGPTSGHLIAVDTTTGTENPPSETLPCAQPAAMSMAAGEVILECGSTVTAFG
ncbi:hypothetical protein [Actinocrispum sp. NPDC049592]|uniref:hypothetical protein n=1 Tax=Actinocrispum sp. NPDC049592 TaxID=3154835 RepID=UPI00342C2052